MQTMVRGTAPTPYDSAGDKVLKFTSAVRNLNKASHLKDEILGMAKSQDWRTYRTAVGTTTWLECEFDYFLIGCDLAWKDVEQAIDWLRPESDDLHFLATIMDHDAAADKRRTLEDAANSYPTAGLETLLAAAQRLGWTKTAPTHRGSREFIASNSLKVAPLPQRARLQHRTGLTFEQKAQQNRVARIDPERRQTLDAEIERIRAACRSEDERRYVIERLKAKSRGTA